MDSHPPAGRDLVHGVCDGEAVSRFVDIERIERHRGGLRTVRLINIVGRSVQRAKGEHAHPALIGTDHPCQIQPREDIGGKLGEFRPEQVGVRGTGGVSPRGEYQ